MNNHKIFAVNSLNMFTTCRILRLFLLASKCEMKILLNKLNYYKINYYYTGLRCVVFLAQHLFFPHNFVKY